MYRYLSRNLNRGIDWRHWEKIARMIQFGLFFPDSLSIKKSELQFSCSPRF